MIALLTSLNEGNDEHVYAIALQVAAAEARRGRVEVGNELQDLVTAARNKRDSPLSSEIKRGGKVVVPITQPRGELQNLLSSSDPSVTLPNLTLSSDIRTRLERFIRQQRERDRLRAFNRVPGIPAPTHGSPWLWKDVDRVRIGRRASSAAARDST